MVFSGIPFLFYFLPLTLVLYFLVPKRLKNGYLLLMSLLFYAWGEPRYVVLMIAAVAVFFGLGLAVEKAATKLWKRIWLIGAVLVGAAMLGVFKYADFAVENWNRLTGMNVPLLKLALPIGISFYTFQCVSSVIDVYRGDVKAQRNPVDFGTYVTLFPQLIAGPIVRYVDVERDLQNRRTTADDFARGLFRFLVGLGKKVLIANPLWELTDIFRSAAEPSVLFYWMYAIAFALHIYFDFSGYSDMAIGIGRILGFHFPENFDHPYVSASVTEFWRRWHMTLGSWFRDYVYIPLGGNRVGKLRWVVNILAVWALTGLWHGAAWNFVVWGLMFAALLLLEKWIPGLKKLPAALRHGYVLLLIVVSFVIFNANNMAQAGQDLMGMFGALDIPLVSAESWYYLRSNALLLVSACVGATPLVRKCALRIENLGSAAEVLRFLVAMIILVVSTAYLVDGSFNPFLYFRF